MINWTQEQIEYFDKEYKKLNSCLVWDSLYREFGYRNQMLRKEIKPIQRDMQIFGPVVTVQGSAHYTSTEVEFDKEGPGPLGGFSPRVEAVVTPHCVIVVQTGYTEVAVLGDIFAMRWQKAGMEGLVVDGPARDSFGMLEENIKCFCTETFAICAENHWKITDINEPMWMHGQLGEVLVNPGDFIYGDVEGVLVIPNEMVEKVLINAQQRLEKELNTKRLIREGVTAKEIVERGLADNKGGM